MNQTSSNEGFGTIVGGLAGDVQDLLRGELALARTELDQKFQTLTASAMTSLGGAFVGFAGLVVVLEGVAVLLGQVLPFWLAQIIVGAVIVAAGMLIAKNGIDGLSVKVLTPEQTVKNLSKDAHMLKDHT